MRPNSRRQPSQAKNQNHPKNLRLSNLSNASHQDVLVESQSPKDNLPLPINRKHRRNLTEVPKIDPTLTNQSQEYFLAEITAEKIDYMKYVSYVSFNQAKLVFFFQRFLNDPNKCYPMETFYINNWLFFRPNIFMQSPKTKRGTPRNSRSNNSFSMATDGAQPVT